MAGDEAKKIAIALLGGRSRGFWDGGMRERSRQNSKISLTFEK
ncbi:MULTISPECIES: hypothetical protein [Planktothricoides]|nr:MULTISPECIES: hypothetical protein [Planktothricoides]